MWPTRVLAAAVAAFSAPQWAAAGSAMSRSSRKNRKPPIIPSSSSFPPALRKSPFVELGSRLFKLVRTDTLEQCDGVTLRRMRELVPETEFERSFFEVDSLYASPIQSILERFRQIGESVDESPNYDVVKSAEDYPEVPPHTCQLVTEITAPDLGSDGDDDPRPFIEAFRDCGVQLTLYGDPSGPWSILPEGWISRDCSFALDIIREGEDQQEEGGLMDREQNSNDAHAKDKSRSRTSERRRSSATRSAKIPFERRFEIPVNVVRLRAQSAVTFLRIDEFENCGEAIRRKLPKLELISSKDSPTAYYRKKSQKVPEAHEVPSQRIKKFREFGSPTLPIVQFRRALDTYDEKNCRLVTRISAPDMSHYKRSDDDDDVPHDDNDQRKPLLELNRYCLVQQTVYGAEGGPFVIYEKPIQVACEETLKPGSVDAWDGLDAFMKSLGIQYRRSDMRMPRWRTTGKRSVKFQLGRDHNYADDDFSTDRT